MQVLIVDYNKMEGFGGGVYEARAVVNCMAALADSVTLLYPSETGRPDPELLPVVRQIPVPDAVSLLKKAWRVIRHGRLHRFGPVFQSTLASSRFDVVVFHNSKGSRGLIDPAKAAGARVIIVHDNYELDYTRDSLPWFLRPFLLPPTVRSERESLLKSDLSLTLSVSDATQMRKAYHLSPDTRVEVLGVSEYKHREQPAAFSEVDGPVFAITGNLSAKQTVDSLLPWLADYEPILRRIVPDARIIVAGKHPSAALTRLLEERGIEVVDTPPDMDGVLARARYYICPVFKGSGVKLRVMDGLRSGLPALVHRNAARGYESFEGKGLFVYQDAPSFESALKTMLSSHHSKEEMFRMYQTTFSYESGILRMKDAVESLSER